MTRSTGEKEREQIREGFHQNPAAHSYIMTDKTRPRTTVYGHAGGDDSSLVNQTGFNLVALRHLISGCYQYSNSSTFDM